MTVVEVSGGCAEITWGEGVIVDWDHVAEDVDYAEDLLDRLDPAVVPFTALEMTHRIRMSIFERHPVLIVGREDR